MTFKDEVEYVREGRGSEERAARIGEVLIPVDQDDDAASELLEWNVRFITALRDELVWPPHP